MKTFRNVILVIALVVITLLSLIGCSKKDDDAPMYDVGGKIQEFEDLANSDENLSYEVGAGIVYYNNVLIIGAKENIKDIAQLGISTGNPIVSAVATENTEQNEARVIFYQSMTYNEIIEMKNLVEANETISYAKLDIVEQAIF